MQETGVQCLGQEDPLEKETAIHSGILAWETPQTEEPGGPGRCKRVGHNLETKTTAKAYKTEAPIPERGSNTPDTGESLKSWSLQKYKFSNKLIL